MFKRYVYFACHVDCSKSLSILWICSILGVWKFACSLLTGEPRECTFSCGAAVRWWMPWRLYQGSYSFCPFFASSWAPCGGMWEEVALSLPLILGPCSFLFCCSNSLFVVFRNRLRLLTQFLEHLVSEGSQDVHVHNALGKISLIAITTQNTSSRFLHGTRKR
jgi:hypothetical protein